MPHNLEPVDPGSRAFPPSWRDAAIRALYDASLGGVVCPSCRGVFRGLKQLKMLQADHIIPWTRGGPTTWQNLQLLCRGCNLAKYNNVPDGKQTLES
jgi:5-methylcytosine-specific restriction endonuclease McrA